MQILVQDPIDIQRGFAQRVLSVAVSFLLHGSLNFHFILFSFYVSPFLFYHVLLKRLKMNSVGIGQKWRWAALFI